MTLPMGEMVLGRRPALQWRGKASTYFDWAKSQHEADLQLLFRYTRAPASRASATSERPRAVLRPLAGLLQPNAASELTAGWLFPAERN